MFDLVAVCLNDQIDSDELTSDNIFSFCVSFQKQKDKKERRELTEEEKQKRAEKKAKWEAKRKENWEKRQLEREQKENKAPGEQGDSVKEEGKEAANGHTEDNLNEKVAA